MRPTTLRPTARRASVCAATLALTLTAACASSPSAPTATSPRASAETLVYLTSGLDADELADFAAIAPNVRFVEVTRDSAPDHAAGAHAVDAHLLSDALLAAAEDLRWVQAWSAGVDRYLAYDGLLDNDRIVFTNMQGAHGPAIAEHVFGLLLALTRQLPRHHAAQREGAWRRDSSGMIGLAERTLLVVGLGGIGSEVAKRAHGFDMRVLATARTAKERPGYVDHLGLAADLDTLLPEADVVVLCVPLTDETRGLFDAARIARMKPGAILINIARGPVVDTDALLAALESGHLAGAGLDVTDPEPLPSGHPLFAAENVIITPHVAGSAAITGERRDAMFRENLRRFAAGLELINVVDKAAGY